MSDEEEEEMIRQFLILHQFLMLHQYDEEKEMEEEMIRQFLILHQYDRAADDYRMYDQAIWQIPSVSITITSDVFAVAFGFIKTNYVIMGTVLILGGIFDLTLLIALSKHRLFQDARAHLMDKIEKEFGIENIPTDTKKVLDFLKERGHKHLSIEWFRRRRGFTWLFWTNFILFIALFAIGIYYFSIGIYYFIYYFVH
ncbi:MAG: hypothetical protein RXP91_06360 [Nitrososphaeria archaeon]